MISGRNVTEKLSNQKMLYFPSHPSSAAALPGEIGNAKIAYFHVNLACCFTRNRRKTF